MREILGVCPTEVKTCPSKTCPSLAAQWLTLHAPGAGDAGLIPVQGTKIPHAARHGQKLLNRTTKKKNPKSCTWMFRAALFTVAKKWKQPKCPSTRNAWTTCVCVDTQQNIIWPLRGMKSDKRHSADPHWRQYTERIQTQEATFYHSIYMKCSE